MRGCGKPSVEREIRAKTHRATPSSYLFVTGVQKFMEQYFVRLPIPLGLAATLVERTYLEEVDFTSQAFASVRS